MEALTAGAMGRSVMGALLLQMSLARRLESQERRLSTTCFDLVLTDSWADGWDTGTYVVMDAAGSAAADTRSTDPTSRGGTPNCGVHNPFMV